MWPGPRLTFIPSGILIHPTIWPQQTGAKNCGLCPFREWRAGSPYNAMWPGPRPTSSSSFISIHPTIWPEYTNMRDRQRGQWSDSMWQTVLQTVAQKWDLFFIKHEVIVNGRYCSHILLSQQMLHVITASHITTLSFRKTVHWCILHSTETNCGSA